MLHKRLWVAATIIASVILVGFVLAIPHTREVKEGATLAAQEIQVPSVTLRDSFKKGTHTISGTVVAPTPCTTLSTQASLITSASDTPSIMVAIQMPEDSGICLNRPVALPFSASIAAPAHTPITVTVNGTQATNTNL